MPTSEQREKIALKAEHLIGRFDLLGGLTVHVKGGRLGRKDLVRLTPNAPGNPLTLLKWYRDQGINRFYVSDLDAQLSQPRQYTIVEKICKQLETHECLWLDCHIKPKDFFPQEHSCSNDLVQRVLHSSSAHPSLRLVLTQLSLKQRTTFSSIADSCDPQRLAMGLRFSDDTDSGTQRQPKMAEEWLEQGHQAGIRSGFLLGTINANNQAEPEILKACRSLSLRFQDWQWACGGIESNHNSHHIHNCGCHGVLVGTTQLANGQIAVL